MVGISCYGKQLVAYEKITEENTKADPAVMNESDEKMQGINVLVIAILLSLCMFSVLRERSLSNV